jgi:integrase
MATMNTHRAKDGTLTYRVRVRVKGQPTQTATFPSLKDAKRWATMMDGQVAEGKHFPSKPTPMTFAELLVKYQAVIQPQKAPMTQRDQASTLKYWRKVFGHTLIAEITPRDLAEQRDVLLARMKPGTVLHKLRVLSSVFTAAVKDFGVLDSNPMLKVRMPAQPQGRVRWLTDEERGKLLTSCQESHNDRLYLLCLCALASGMRPTELLNIRWKDIDLVTGVAQLERTKTKRRRSIPMTGLALEMLRALRENHPNDEYIFPATNRSAPSRSYRKAWEHALKRAGLSGRDIVFYSLRHTTASYLVQAGVPLYTVSGVLGHTSPTTTAIYAHLTTDTLRNALETMTKAKFQTSR